MSAPIPAIIDTHLHLAYRDHFSHPWMAEFPDIDHAWTATEYFDTALPLGIVSALHMENDVPESQILPEARFMGSAHPRLIAAIASGRPEREDFPAQLEALVTLPHIKGIRRILHVMPDELSTTGPFASNVRRLADFGLTFDLCVRADQLDRGLALVDAAPQVQFILDHCGNPDLARDGFADWKRGMEAMASRPNVAVKVSGMVAGAGPDWSVPTIVPFISEVIVLFGWDRVVWGSDHPVVTLGGTLAKWVNATREIVAGASLSDQEKLFSKNAIRIYRLESTL